MSNELTTTKSNEIQEFELIQRQARMFFESGLFSDTRSLAQAAVKIMAGRELGVGPFESMRDINIISGKTTLAAANVAARIQRAGGDWTPIKYDAEGCILRFSKGGKILSPDISFGIEEAKALDLLKRDNYQKQPRTMFFWRAITMGARMFFPGVFGGPIYTPDEISSGVVEPLPEPPISAKVVEAAEEKPVDVEAAIETAPEPKTVANPEPFNVNPFSHSIQLTKKDSKSSLSGKLLCEVYFEDRGKIEILWQTMRQSMTLNSQAALGVARNLIKQGTADKFAAEAFRDEHGYEPEAVTANSEAPEMEAA